MPFGGLVVNRVHRRADDGELPASWSPPSSAPALAERVADSRRASWPRWPRATPRTSTACATELGDPADDRRPRARGRRARRRRARPVRAHLFAADRRSARRAARRSELVGERRSAGSRWPQSTSRRTARRQRRARRRAPRPRRRAHEAGDRGALERDRLAQRAARARRGPRALGADRGEPLGDALVAGRSVSASSARAGEQPVGQRLDGD